LYLRVSKPCKCSFLAAKTTIVALQIASHKRTKSICENKVGTKIETLANFAREFIDGSGGY